MKDILYASTVFILLLLCTSCAQEGEKMRLPDQVDYNFHIKPILSDRCFACHGPDENTREAELALHTEEGLFSVLDSSDGVFVVKPGDPSRSALYHRVCSNDPEYVMPPPAFNLTITDHERRLIEKWIRQGATWKDHWAFIPPTKSALPSSGHQDKIINEIDPFIIHQLDEIGLKPSQQESPEKLIRRVYFDLTGLPPSLENIEEFVEDPSDAHYENIVTQLLESPRYGERMASIWLDLARYADSHGYQDDRPRTVWPWRDWVVRAFNQNLSYQDFVTWQIAGDMLPEATYDQKLATTFNRNHPITQEGGVIDEEYLTEYAADRVQTFSTAFLGLTMECARCHDHKYDPIGQEEFYQLFGFFNNVKGETGRISYFDLAPTPNLLMSDAEHEAHIKRVKEKIASLQDKTLELSETEQEFFENWRQNSDLTSIDANHQNLLSFMSMEDDGDWSFEDGADSSRSGKVNVNLPPSIVRPRKVDGRFGSALEFNGDNFLTLGEIGDFDWYDDFSLGAWISHGGKHRKVAGILSRRNGEQYRQGYDLSITPDNRITFRLIHNYNDAYLQVTTLSRIPRNEWKQVYVTYDGSGQANGVSLFVDGQRQPTRIDRDSLSDQSILNGNDLLVGHWNHRARELKNLYGFEGGRVDEVRVYDQRLSGLQIRSLYRPGLRASANKSELFEHYLLNHSIAFASVKNQLDSLRAIDVQIPHIPIMQEADTIKPAYLLSRGMYDAHRQEVSRGTPKAILAFDARFDHNRLGLADWLFDPANPLTARVMTNRLWHMCFGRGLVNTAEDFGSQGDLPSHPALLDWLSVDFREHNWDIKALLRKMVTSATYRQSAQIDAKRYRLDPENQYLSRGPRKAFTAEMVRDQALAISGLLDHRIGGKWVKPYQPAGIWKEMANQIGENKYRPSTGKNLYRRSLYTYWKRTIPPPTMLTFDAPERAICVVKRQSTSTPLQALVLMNDPTYLEASRVLTNQILDQEPNLSDEEQIDKIFRSITARAPSHEEMDKLLKLYQQMQAHYHAHPGEAKAILTVGAYPHPSGIDLETTAAMTLVVSTIFNLDEAKYY